MPDQIYIGANKGLKKDVLPFNIDNEAFATLFNAYAWRGRVKRKRGTSLLGQLQRQLHIAAVPNKWQVASFNLVAGAGNLISQYTLGTSSSIAPGTISLVVGANTYTDPAMNGILVGAPGGSGTINYATGAFTISGGGASAVTGTFSYYPGLPVMGLEDFVDPSTAATFNTNLYPLLLGFDTTYSYQVNQAAAPFFYSTSYYKSTNSPVIWNGGDYQQFWTTNFQGALWATNNVPGLHFVNATYTSGTGTALITFNFKSLGVNYPNLIVGDSVWFNQWSGGSTINGLTGTVSTAADAVNGNYVVTFSAVQTVAGTGIAQLLTASISGQDGIRWYDGDPTGATGLPTSTGLGWVNFAPPLTATTVSIDDTPAALYYLVGALGILPFKDRLLFIRPYIQTAGGTPILLSDTILWSWNGTPYYATPVPTNQTADVTAYYVRQTGKGGYLPAGIPQPITTFGNNEDAILVGFGGDGRKTRFVYTGNDIQPFLFFNINSEMPSQSTFSVVNLDRGMLDIGQYGVCMTDQQSAQRVDLDIPDEIFQIKALEHGVERVTAVRDFFREWIYFCYPFYSNRWKFPTQTLMFNYRDNTWSILYENYTTYGRFRSRVKKTWQTLPFKTWNSWRQPWNVGSDSPLYPDIIAGNPQGYVLITDEGTGEATSGTIKTIANDGFGNTLITSINHCVSTGDYLLITGCLGTTALNDQIGRVGLTPTADTFSVDLAFPAGTYLGLGKFTRLSQPLIQTKQFPFYWNDGRQTRLAVQKYLMDYTENSQVTVNIYLSQDPDDAWNSTPVNPSPNSLVYSQIMYTSPESTNIGLTPANTNLQMPTAEGQYQIWHRFNTSLIGDSVQVGITLSDTQMRNITYATAEIGLHAMQLTFERGPHLA